MWEDKIRMDLKEIGIITRNWVDSAQDKCRDDDIHGDYSINRFICLLLLFFISIIYLIIKVNTYKNIEAPFA